MYMLGDSTRCMIPLVVGSGGLHHRHHYVRGADGQGQSMWGNPCNYSLPSSTEEENMLVIVIGGGSKPVYAMLRAFWRMTASHAASHGIHVYIVGRNPNITKPHEGNGTLVFAGNEIITLGILEQTVDAVPS